MHDEGELGVVLSGGGARAAYQVGILRGLGRRFPDLRLRILTGASAGAINAVFLAAHREPLGAATVDLCRLWQSISFEDVFRVDLPWLARNFVRWLMRLGLGGSRMRPDVRALMDTTPLESLLRRALATPRGEITALTDNVARGHLKALALATVHYATGQTVNWVQGHNVPIWQRPDRHNRIARLTVEHVMASASLPLVFPAIKLEGGWYGDGGIRLASPLSPALHLGANRILVISTRYPRSRAEADQPNFIGYPPPAQIIGNLMNAIFLDVLDQDVRRLERVNLLLHQLPPANRHGLRPVGILCLRPSRDLGRLTVPFEPRLPAAFRFLTRSLGSHETSSPDFLSLLMFHHGYLQELIALGEADVEARLPEIEVWLKAWETRPRARGQTFGQPESPPSHGIC